MDFYLSEENVTERLITEWEKYGSIVIAYDFDNTIYDYHQVGHKYDCVVDLLKKCKEAGAYLILFTARRDDEMDFVKYYLNSNDIPYDSINEDPVFITKPGRKVYYNILLDDRAGLPSAYKSLKEAYEYIVNKK